MKYLGFLKKIENTNYSRIEIVAATPQNDQSRLDLLHHQTLCKLFPPEGTVFLQESATCGLDDCFVLFSYIKKNTSGYKDVYKDKFMLDGKMEKVDILKTHPVKPVQAEMVAVSKDVFRAACSAPGRFRRCELQGRCRPQPSFLR